MERMDFRQGLPFTASVAQSFRASQNASALGRFEVQKLAKPCCHFELERRR